MHDRLKHILTVLLVCCLVMSVATCSVSTASADEAITKVLTTLSSTPVALVDPALITVETSSPACYIISAGWFNAANQPVTGAFNAETYRLEITVGARDGYYFDPDVACYLNNSSITGIVADSGQAVTLVREYTADVWAPTVYKNPGDETVDEGGWASFVVSGSYVRAYEWVLIDPAGKVTVPVSELRSRFQGMDYSGDGSTKLILYHIPYELNNWKVVCNFIGVGDGNVTPSKPAIITVRADPSRVVSTPAPSAVPSATPAPTPSAPVEATFPPVETSPLTHEHDFSGPWHYDARGHWHERPDDGMTADEALHSYTWTETVGEDGQSVETGVCNICGYTSTRRSASSFAESTATDSPESDPADNDVADPMEISRPDRVPVTALMAVLCALLPVDAALIALRAANTSRKKPRR